MPTRIKCPVCETTLEIYRDSTLLKPKVRPIRFNSRIAILRHESCGWKIRGKLVVARELGLTVEDVERVCQWAKEGRAI